MRVAKWLGDGAMIVCLDRSDAIATALDLECAHGRGLRPLAFRAGVAGGHALLFEGDDYIGSAVNLASRLCDAAGPMRCCCPPPGRRSTGGHCRHAVGALALRGFNQPVPVVELSGQPPLASRNDTGELWIVTACRLCRRDITPSHQTVESFALKTSHPRCY